MTLPEEPVEVPKMTLPEEPIEVPKINLPATVEPSDAVVEPS